MRERDEIAFPVRKQLAEHSVARLARRLFDGHPSLACDPERVDVIHLHVHAAPAAETLGELGVFYGVFAADTVFDVYGKEVRSRRRQKVEQHDGIASARKRKRNARAGGHAQTEFFSRNRFHNITIIKQFSFICKSRGAASAPDGTCVLPARTERAPSGTCGLPVRTERAPSVSCSGRRSSVRKGA